jgi:hypothetical protein
MKKITPESAIKFFTYLLVLMSAWAILGILTSKEVERVAAYTFGLVICCYGIYKNYQLLKMPSEK